MAPSKSNGFSVSLIVLAVAVLLVGGLLYLNQPDRRTPAERAGDAVEKLGDGVGDAARELTPRTPGEKLGDAVKDAGETIKDTTEKK